MAKVVLFVAPSAYPLGGVQTWLDYVVEGIESHSCRSVLALTKGRHHDTDAYLKVHPFDRVELIESPTGSIQGRIESLERLIKRIRPDVIVVVNIADVYRAINNIRRREVLKTKVVTSIHGIHPGLIDDIKTYRHVIDAVISTNRLTQKLVTAKTDIEPHRSLYAPYGVAESQLKRAPNNENLTVAYVGRLEEDQKRVSDLLKIFSAILQDINNLEILIAGGGPETHALTSWIKNANRSDKVKYLGVLEPEELWQEIYAKADILLLTSHWETGPIVVWEAMSCGVTVVSSKYIGHAEENSLVDGENCFLFNIGDVQGAVEKIKVANNSDLRNTLMINALSLIEKKYTITQSVSTWSNCIDSITGWEPKPYKALPATHTDKGRLSSILVAILGEHGFIVGEKIKNIFGIHFKHSSAGSEWPHSYSSVNSDSSELSNYIKDQ